ncbi:MAG: hypothetical protein KJ077_27955 [Anaerolineae bacterium]|nr:hypothetical protein [Anaerolineae bacterium]
MSIRDTTLEKEGAPYVLILNPDTVTLNDALAIMKQEGYRANQVYLIVSQPGQVYQVILFSDLRAMKEMYDMPGETPLDALPIPLASRVVPQDTPEGGGMILRWRNAHSQSTIVVTKADGGVGLLTNPNRSGELGILDWLSFLTKLHGEPIKLIDDPRTGYGPQRCPSCKKVNTPKFDPEQKRRVCRECGQAI